MTSAEPYELDDLAGRIRGLAIVLMDTLTADEFAEVERFLGHSEYGEALLALAWIIEEESKSVPESVLHAVHKLGVELEIESELPRWEGTHITSD